MIRGAFLIAKTEDQLASYECWLFLFRVHKNQSNNTTVSHQTKK